MATSLMAIAPRSRDVQGPAAQVAQVARVVPVGPAVPVAQVAAADAVVDVVVRDRNCIHS
jgi:hypothetical protein